MSKSTLTQELHEAGNKRTKDALVNSTPILVVRGLWLFAEGAALLITSLYAIYQGHYGDMPNWGQYILTVAGVLVLIPAALLLAKFFRAASKA